MEEIRLNLGAGASRIPGFLNVDMNPEVGADVAAGIDELPYAENSIAVIYASHVLEHYLPKIGSKAEQRAERTIKLLAYWYKLLRPGGELYIAVPDFNKLAELAVANFEVESVTESVIDAIYGGQRNEFDFHYSGYSRTILTKYLAQAGFSEIQVFEPFGNDETNHRINGQNISLNLKARKLSEKIIPPFVPPEIQEDELSMYRNAADERLAVMLQLQKHIDYLQGVQKDHETQLKEFNTSPRKLVKTLFKIIFGRQS